MTVCRYRAWRQALRGSETEQPTGAGAGARAATGAGASVGVKGAGSGAEGTSGPGLSGAAAGADRRSSLGLLGAVLLSETVWNVQLFPSFTHALQHHKLA